MTLLRFKNIKLQSYKPGKSLLAGNKNIIKLSANESALGVSKNVEKIVKSKFDISKYYINLLYLNYRYTSENIFFQHLLNIFV